MFIFVHHKITNYLNQPDFMKTRNLLTTAFMFLAMSASAQIQLLYMNSGRNVIDRTKKLYWMEGDDDPCFTILNYKKSGNKETFTLKAKEAGDNQTYSVAMTLNGQSVPTHIVIKDGKNVVDDSEVRTTSGNADEDNRMYDYFGGLAGYPASQRTTVKGVPAKPTAKDVKEQGAKGVADKVGDAAKGAFGKVKGLFKKKK